MSWRTIFILGGGATLVLLFAAVVVSIFATVNYEDAIIEAKWVSARGLTHPTPGSLYVLTEEGLHGRPICSLEITGDHLVGQGRTRKYVFSNVVGDLMPILADLSVFLLGRDVQARERSVDGPDRPFDLVWVADEIYVRSFTNVPMDKDCQNDAIQAVKNGLIVCTVDRAIIAPGDDSMVYAVGFRNTCQSECAVGEENCDMPGFNPTSTYNWTSRLKKEFGLVRLIRAPIEQ